MRTVVLHCDNNNKRDHPEVANCQNHEIYAFNTVYIDFFFFFILIKFRPCPSTSVSRLC